MLIYGKLPKGVTYVSGLDYKKNNASYELYTMVKNNHFVKVERKYHGALIPDSYLISTSYTDETKEYTDRRKASRAVSRQLRVLKHLPLIQVTNQ